MKIYIVVPALAVFSALALLLGSVLTVNAGHHNYKMFSANMTDLDNNGDGVVSFEEYEAFHSEQLRWSFNALDTDNDGSISESEWEQFLKMHGVSKGFGSDKKG